MMIYKVQCKLLIQNRHGIVARFKVQKIIDLFVLRTGSQFSWFSDTSVSLLHVSSASPDLLVLANF